MREGFTTDWSEPAEVWIGTGGLRGSASPDGAVRRFIGVRYAEAPSGDRRWRPPVPVAAWEGIRDARSNPPAAMQAAVRPDSIYSGGESTFSEDCLFVNVWTGAEGAADRPVLVWLHWGGFQFGSTGNPVFDGEMLAREGVTVVSVGYRLGRFGFLAHEWLTAESEHGASGNYGLLDQIEALRWVRRHIASFGGDPNRVTLAGCSAGAVSVWLLRSSPLAARLFHRAIAQSGQGIAPAIDGPGRAGVLQTRAAAEQAGAELVAAVGAQNLHRLRALPPEAILTARLDRQQGPWRLPFLPPAVGLSDAPFDTGYPIVDGHVLPRSPWEVFRAGEQIDVPMIAGNTGNEASGLPFIGTLDAYVSTVRSTYGDFADELLSLYPASDDEGARGASNRLIGDRTFVWGTATGARLHARTGRAPVWTYRFLRRPPIPADVSVAEERDRVGAYHGADVQYAFGTLRRHAWDWTDADHELSDAMRRAWAAFASDADPNDGALPHWPALDERRPATMVLDLRPHLTGALDQERLAFWDRYFSASVDPGVAIDPG